MIARDVSPANMLVHAVLSEVVALRLLAQALVERPQEADSICDCVITDLKAGVGEYIAHGKGSRDPKALRAAEAMEKDLTAMIAQIETLKANVVKPKE
jgi:hypothetical protein